MFLRDATLDFDDRFAKLMGVINRIASFAFHDLKRRGVSDTEGDKLQTIGHKSASMLAVYDVSVPEVTPTK